MANTFQLEILTPTRHFFSGQVDALTFQAKDGEWTILKDHAPMIAALRAGSVKFRVDGVWREAVNSEGYMEVSAGGIIANSKSTKSCWPGPWPGCATPSAISTWIDRAAKRLFAAKRSARFLDRQRQRDESYNRHAAFVRGRSAPAPDLVEISAEKLLKNSPRGQDSTQSCPGAVI